MRLHYHPLSSYSRKVATAIELRGDDVELRVIDVFGGALRSETYRALSPFGKMPVLETDDGPLIESTSIIELLEERGPRRLIPEAHARVARHFDRLGDLYLLSPGAAYWWRPDSPEGEAAPRTAERAWALFARQLDDGRPFVCGDTFTLGDLGAAIATDYLARLGLEPPTPIRAWTARCFDVPAMRDSLEEALPFVEKAMAGRK